MAATEERLPRVAFAVVERDPASICSIAAIARPLPDSVAHNAVGFQQPSAVVRVARSFEQTLACGARFLILAARVADVPEAPKRRNPLRGIVQLIHQVTRAQIEIFHLSRACPFQAMRAGPIWMQMLSSVVRVSSLRQRLHVFQRGREELDRLAIGGTRRRLGRGLAQVMHRLVRYAPAHRVVRAISTCSVNCGL